MNSQPAETITSAAVVLSSAHGRERRHQRNITKRDLQAAVLYGKKEAAPFTRPGERRWMYTFADIVYLTDSTSTREITSWPLACCGIDVPKKEMTSDMYQKHKRSIILLKDKSSWTSHTVAVVDQSGSMRNSDASEEATRSDVVWLTLALDFVRKKLESGESTETDVFSLVSMRSEGEILIKEQPMDWLLYNKIIELLRTQRPMGHGNYIPALNTAEELLISNPYSNCALLLIFLSDGRPSDQLSTGTLKEVPAQTQIEKLTIMGKQRVSNLASRFGRRLTVGAIAFGQPEEEDFSTLKGFAEAAIEYGSHGLFRSASLSVETLAETFTTLSSTLTSTKVEMTEIGGSTQRKVREVYREPISSLGGVELDNHWLYFPYSSESGSIVKTTWTKDGWHPVPRKYIFSSSEATGVALKKRFFGEGAERLVREFREVGKDGKFIGEAMVGKESRFITSDGNEDLKEFHKTFCKTQKLAQKLARVFNKRLQNLPFADEKSMPSIKFLDCCVYMVNDPKRGRYGLLAEKMLNIKTFQYKKWNSNDGLVYGGESGKIEAPKLDIQTDKLGDIIEESEEEDDDSWDELKHEEGNKDAYNVNDSDASFTYSDIPQVFSCFTYRYTKRRMLVCDLQGILNKSKCPPVFEMTDPVIHYKSSRQRRHVYGRTDKGQDGIHNFYRTHVCSKLCWLVHRRWLRRGQILNGSNNQAKDFDSNRNESTF